jgi:hypothetical protein
VRKDFDGPANAMHPVRHRITPVAAPPMAWPARAGKCWTAHTTCICKHFLRVFAVTMNRRLALLHDACQDEN